MTTINVHQACFRHAVPSIWRNYAEFLCMWPRVTSVCFGKSHFPIIVYSHVHKLCGLHFQYTASWTHYKAYCKDILYTLYIKRHSCTEMPSSLEFYTHKIVAGLLFKTTQIPNYITLKLQKVII